MSKQSNVCPTCDGKIRVTRENHLYVESGLPNVVLAGIEIHRCPKCGTFEMLLPRVTELYRVIAMTVIYKPARLNGAEVRFLRKYLGWSADDFAVHMGVDPTTVSAWENERRPFGTSSDRLLRLMIAHQAPVEDYSLDDLTRIADVQGRPRKVEIRSTNHGWQVAA